MINNQITETVQKDKSITIPCKKHVRKYLHARYGQQLRITNHSLTGIFIYAVIEKKYYESRHRKFGGGFVGTHYNDSITLLASSFVFENIGFDLSPEKILAVNRFLEVQLEEHLFMYCDAYVLAGRQRKQAICDFAEKYNIDLEIDVSYDSLKQTEFRLRRKRQQAPVSLGPAERPVKI